MKYDDASWHYESIENANDENDRWDKASSHIVIYLKWCFGKGFIRPENDDARIALLAAANGNGSFTEYFINWCDCKLIDHDLSDEGKRFTADYYELYLDELGKVANNHILRSPVNEYPFEAIKNALDDRFLLWQSEGKSAFSKLSKINHPWWKIW